MFSKLFFASLVSMLALSASSSESTQAGRYRTEGPGNSGNSGAQTGRYRGESYSLGSNQGQVSAAQNGDVLVAGRYRQSDSNFAPSGSYVRESEYARIQTERAPAADVSNKPVNAHDHK